MLKLKVMIVEDESLERLLLKNYLEASADFFELVKEASFALEALEYLDEHTVDIVITDINMPVMDGLSMAQHIVKLDPNVQVIVITGYNDFDHAQRAIKIGVADYLVKPVAAKEFAGVLMAVREKMLGSKGSSIVPTEIEMQIAQCMPALRDRFLNELVAKRLEPAVIKERLSFFKLEMAGDHFQTGVVMPAQNASDEMQLLFTLFSAGNIAREMLESSCIFLGDRQVVIISSSYDEKPADFDALKRVLEGTLNIPVAIGVGTVVTGLENIRQSYAQAVRAAHCHTFLGTAQVIYYQDLGVVGEQPSFIEPMQVDMAELEQIGFFLWCGLNANVRAWVEQHFDIGNENIEKARLRAVMVISNLYAMHVEPFMNIKERIAKTLDLNTVSEIREMLLSLMGEATSTLEDIRIHTVSSQIQDIVDYVRENLSDTSLSLHETSRQFFFNASYLSRIFKQNTGMSFREYVNKQRIELARKYLDDPDAKAYEVGVRVGIDDPNYFSTLFKKYTGMTIKQYRAGQ